MRKDDARKLDHATLEAMRTRAVASVQAGESPEAVAKALRINRTTIYNWLAAYRHGGWNALKAKPEIYFGDVAHVRSDHHAGRTWGKVGETPIVQATGARFGFSMISAVTAKGQMRFMVVEGGVNADVFIEFLKRLMLGATRKVFLIVD